MNTWINARTNAPCRKILTSLCNYSTFITAHPSVTSPQRIQYGKEENKEWRNITNLTLAIESRPASTAMNHVDSTDCWHDVIKMVSYLCILPKTCNPSLTMRKDMRQAPVVEHPTKQLTSVPYSCQVTKHKVSLKKSHSLSVMW